MEPAIGQYGVVQTKTISGFFIQMGTRSRDDHAFIYIGEGQIVEATPKRGVIVSDVHKYSNIAWNRHEPVTQAKGIQIAAIAYSMVGQKYRFRAILAIACKILHLPLPKSFTADLDDQPGVICSELVVKCYRAAGRPIEGSIPAHLVSPADLAYRLLYI